jgi:NDP-sugar pyrophosphorylase family protein
VSFLPKLKIEVAVSSELADAVVDAIVTSARTGQIGDGKIFVSSLERAVRIRTGEKDESKRPVYYKHIGLYAFTKEFLFTFRNLPKSSLENAEKLEQLRVLENGYKIKVVETKFDTVGVDRPEDLKRAEEALSHAHNELEKRVDSGEMAVAFALHPTRMDQLMAVADSNNVMPPKSTWFEPKLADGLVSHVLD